MDYVLKKLLMDIEQIAENCGREFTTSTFKLLQVQPSSGYVQYEEVSVTTGPLYTARINFSCNYIPGAATDETFVMDRSPINLPNLTGYFFLEKDYADNHIILRLTEFEISEGMPSIQNAILDRIRKHVIKCRMRELIEKRWGKKLNVSHYSCPNEKESLDNMLTSLPEGTEFGTYAQRKKHVQSYYNHYKPLINTVDLPIGGVGLIDVENFGIRLIEHYKMVRRINATLW